VASSQSHVGDLVKRKSAIASMLYEKAPANAGIRRNNSEEAITQRCGLRREPLIGNVKRSHTNYYPYKPIAQSSLYSLFLLRQLDISSLRLVTSSFNFSSAVHINAKPIITICEESLVYSGRFALIIS
jgi:hypothetical protein